VAQREPVSEKTLGGVYAFLAYLLWGFLPMYFLVLAPTGAWELVTWRILLSLVFCVLILWVTRSFQKVFAIVRQPRLLLWTAVAGLLIYVNWQIFVLGILTGHIVETSLGYFINPIITVLLGVIVLRERLRVMQWVAIAIAVGAVLVIIVGYGSFPWIALSLAISFALYGLVKKQIGPSVDAVSGLTLETAWLTPIAIAQLVLVAMTGGITFGTSGLGHALLVSFAGVATTVPLLLFAAGTRRVPLSLIGLLQFLTPFMQFALGVWIMHEPMPPERWIGFGLVWVALVILTVDMLIAVGRQRRAGANSTRMSEIDRAWTGSTPLPK
jgi:chloramphenicol-sensitive protein RarD